MLRTDALEPATLAALKKLMEVLELADHVLVGGTGLALHFGHRISVDIDLFAEKEFDNDLVQEAIRQKGEVELLNATKLGLFMLFDGVKTDIIRHPYPWIEPVVIEQNIRLASIEDIAAMKIAAITRRGSKKDFVDLYFLLKKYGIEDILSFFQKKFNQWDVYAAIRSLTYFEDAETNEDPTVLDPKTSWPIVKKGILKACEKLRI